MIRPVVSVSRSNNDIMARQLTGNALAHYTNVEGPRLAQMAERKAEELARQRTQRREGNRHKANTTHLENSYRGQVVRAGDRVEIQLTTKPGVNAKKVAAIEYGTDKPYEIRPRNANMLVWEPGLGGSRTGAAKVVKRQPFEGKHIMRDAIATVIAYVRQKR